MQVTDVIARLKTGCPLLKGRVYGAAELAIAVPTTMQPPCAFVIPLSESSESNKLLGGFSQLVTAKFGVVVAVRNFSDTRGEGGHKFLETVRTEIFDTLNGWQHQNDSSPVEHVNGDLAGYDNLLLRWNDVFQTQFYYRKVS